MLQYSYKVEQDTTALKLLSTTYYNLLQDSTTKKERITTMKNSTAASRYYKVDFLNNTVYVSASFLKKASVLGSPEYQ